MKYLLSISHYFSCIIINKCIYFNIFIIIPENIFIFYILHLYSVVSISANHMSSIIFEKLLRVVGVSFLQISKIFSELS